MKATLDARAFAQLTSRVSHTAQKGRSTLPVLHTILLRVEGNALTLQSTNLEQATTVTMWADVAEDGAITVDARWLVAQARHQATGGLIHLETGTNDLGQCTLTVARAGGSVSTTGIDAEEFPLWESLVRPDAYETCYCTALAVKTLRMIQDLVMPAAGDDLTRPLFTGLSCQFRTNGSLEVAATDGYHLSVFEGVHHPRSGSNVFPAGCSCVIPAATWRLLPKVLLGKETREVSVTIDPKAQVAEFDAGAVVLRSRLIEGQYIRYRQIMPTTHGCSLSIDRAALLSALAAVLPPGTKKSDMPVVRLDVTADGLTLVQRTAEQRAEVTLPSVGSGTFPVSVYLMAPQLREALLMFPTFGRVILRLTDGWKPVVFVGDPAPALPDETCCHLLMCASLPDSQKAMWKAA